GKAIGKFAEMVKKQGGNPKVIYDLGLLPWAKFRVLVNSDRQGYVQSIDTRRIGLCAVELGAGRKRLDDPIDHGVGMLIKKKVGDSIGKGEALAIVFANNLKKARQASHEIRGSYKITKSRAHRLKKVLMVVDEKGSRTLRSKART
ncbi:MAG: pyrimidine-nucleoside phosphorylase, partial [Candidatus Zixiibacteriota bacterium]